MLGKLLKYEFMAEWKKYIIIFGGMIFLALSMLILNKGFMSTDNYIVEAAFELVMVAFVMLCLFALFIIFVFSTIRFYKNMFRDEGYLMNTLPCTVGQHLASKMISTYVWYAATAVVIVLSVSIAAGDFTWIAEVFRVFSEMDMMIKEEAMVMGPENAAEMEAIFGFFKSMFVYMIVTLVLMPVMYQIYLNFCIAVGSLFNTHKILMAVITFVAVNVISQVVSTVGMFILGYGNIVPILESDSMAEMDVVLGFMNNVYIFSGVVSVIFYGVMLWATHYIMSKKLNLA